MFVRRGAGAGFAVENFFVQIGHPFFFSANVERAIPADGEEPFRGRVVELLAPAALQFHKGFLHNIAGAVAITGDAGGVLQKRKLEAPQQLREIEFCKRV